MESHAAEPAARQRHRQRAGEAARLARAPGEEGGEVQEAQGARCARSSCTPPSHRFLELHARDEGARRRGWRTSAARSARALERVQRARGARSTQRRAALEAKAQALAGARRARCTRWRARCSSTRRTSAHWREGRATRPRPRVAQARGGARARSRRAQAEVRRRMAAREAELSRLAGALEGRRGRAAGRAGGAAPGHRSCRPRSPLRLEQERDGAGGAWRRGWRTTRATWSTSRSQQADLEAAPREEPRRGRDACAREEAQLETARAPRWPDRVGETPAARAGAGRAHAARKRRRSRDPRGVRGERDPGHLRCARSWPTSAAASPRCRRFSATTKASTAACAR